MNLGQQYASLAKAVYERVPDLKPVYCGFSACVDHLYDLELVLRALDAEAGEAAYTLRAKLTTLADAGQGGEIEVAWPEGERFFAALPPKRRLPGGTGVQAANQLALFGAKPVLALERRDPALLALLHGHVVLAPIDDHADHRAPPAPVPIHPIVEFSPADHGAGPVRADRIIVRFSEDPIEQDEAFAQHASNPANAAGAAVVSGFNALRGERLTRALAWGRDLLRRWAAIDLPLVHLELADFQSMSERDAMLDAFAGLYTSIGMNVGELRALFTDDLHKPEAILQAVSSLARELGVTRVTVHEDRWALSFTQHDPAIELRALQFGCLTASARAHAGQPTRPAGLPAGAALVAPPWPEIAEARRDGHFVCCSAPYLDNPASTVGLGDSFLAGTLAVLAGSRSPSTWKDLT